MAPDDDVQGRTAAQQLFQYFDFNLILKRHLTLIVAETLVLNHEILSSQCLSRNPILPCGKMNLTKAISNQHIFSYVATMHVQYVVLWFFSSFYGLIRCTGIT